MRHLPKNLLAVGLVALLAGSASAQTNPATAPTGQTNASLQAQRLYSGLTAALPNTQPIGTLGPGLTPTTGSLVPDAGTGTFFPGSSALLGQQQTSTDPQVQRLYSGLIAALPTNPAVPQTSRVPGFTAGGNLQTFGSAAPASVPLVGQLGVDGISVNATPPFQRLYNGLIAAQPQFPSAGTTGAGTPPFGPSTLLQTPGLVLPGTQPFQTPFNPAINPGNAGIPPTGTVNPALPLGAGTSAPGAVNPANPGGLRTVPGTGTTIPMNPGTASGTGRPGGR